MTLTTWDSSVLQKAGIWQDSSSPNTRRDGERVSPPPTSFGVGVVNMALGRYSRSSSLSQSSETHIISREAVSQQEEGGAPQGRSSAGGGRGNRGRGSEDFSYAKSLDFEVVSEKTGGPVHRTLTSLLTKLVPERGLDSQNYCCAACRRPIGVIFGASKLCKYNGQHYCFDCHIDDERIVPSRVLFNWDFRRHRVCRASCEFLDSIADSAVLNVEESNPALYMYIPELEEALRLRQQLNSLRGYLATCRQEDSLQLLTKRLKSPHLYEEIHSYSIQELSEVHSGGLLERMRKTVRTVSTHVRQCPLCSQKGFICEGCHGNNIIYPFDLRDTYQCPSCSAVYHYVCTPEKGNCSKCLRIHQRRQALCSDF